MIGSDRVQGRGGRVRGRRRWVGAVERLEGRALLATLYVDAGNATGVEDGTQAHPYSRIQAAIDHSAPSGDTVSVAAGVYAEALTIPHALTLAGPNAGINPNAATRQAE